MNGMSSKGKKAIVINIILYIICTTVYILGLNNQVSPYIVYGMLLAMIVDVILLFSKYFLKAFKDLEPKLIIAFTIPILSSIVWYIKDII